MANLGVYIELRGDEFKKANREALALAKKSNRDVYAIIFANDISQYENELKGISKVIQIKNDNLSYQPEAYAATIGKIIKEHNLNDILGVASAQGKDLFPRIAALIGGGIINDCIDVDFNSNTVKKPVYAGKLISTFKLSGEFRIITIRPNVFPVKEGGSDTQPEITTTGLETGAGKLKIIDVIKSETKKIDLTEADIIISGGRGMKAKENFKILQEVADILNAGVGASRAAVDSDYATPDMQVGQTGKVVNPKLYIACGISGAIQHFVGMKTSKVIVAINKDSEAPIFKKANYGIVADLFKAIPVLKEELKKVL
ncbi:MAG: electron transfer flavoprotein subunit alpha/FixB family protein [Candidatus Aminicenantes bacterium]|nr:electron transfer flavoprotein subunit alpha/FixB family protein [Candidatus Aminicenantes bacterium]